MQPSANKNFLPQLLALGAIFSIQLTSCEGCHSMPSGNHVVIDHDTFELSAACMRRATGRIASTISSTPAVLREENFDGPIFRFDLQASATREFVVSIIPSRPRESHGATVSWIYSRSGTRRATRSEIEDMRVRGFSLLKLIYECEVMNLATAHFSYCFGEANPEACRRYVAEPTDAGAVPLATLDGMARPARGD